MKQKWTQEQEHAIYFYRSGLADANRAYFSINETAYQSGAI
jgi:hypothetical protein